MIVDENSAYIAGIDTSEPPEYVDDELSPSLQRLWAPSSLMSGGCTHGFGPLPPQDEPHVVYYFKTRLTN